MSDNSIQKRNFERSEQGQVSEIFQSLSEETEFESQEFTYSSSDSDELDENRIRTPSGNLTTRSVQSIKKFLTKIIPPPTTKRGKRLRQVVSLKSLNRKKNGK